jgi:hypothetical protein
VTELHTIKETLTTMQSRLRARTIWTATTSCVAATVIALGIGAAVAFGHGGASSGDYRSYVTAITPKGVPITARVVQGDDQLRVENEGSDLLVIYGYELDKHGNPQEYIRLGPGGVYVNHHSPAYYLNQDRLNPKPPPKSVTADAKPDFQRVRSRPAFYTFHDHRIHWMSPTPPRSVDTGSTKAQKIYDWEVPFRYGDTQGTIKGRLDYVGGKPWYGSIELVLTVLAIVAMVGILIGDALRRRRRGHADPAGAPPADGA